MEVKGHLGVAVLPSTYGFQGFGALGLHAGPSYRLRVFGLFLFMYFEKGSCSVTQAGLELTV